MYQLSALTDRGRLEKLFAGRNRSQSSKCVCGVGVRVVVMGCFVKQPALPKLRTSTAALESHPLFGLSCCHCSTCMPFLPSASSLFCHHFLYSSCFSCFYCFISSVPGLLHCLTHIFSVFPPSHSTHLFPHQPIAQAFLSVKKAKAGREWDLFFSPLQPMSSLFSCPKLFYLLHDKVQDSIEINHLPGQHCMCVRVCQQLTSKGSLMVWWCWVFCCGHGSRTATLLLCVCVCVLLMLLAVTCPHCYQRDLCSLALSTLCFSAFCPVPAHLGMLPDSVLFAMAFPFFLLLLFMIDWCVYVCESVQCMFWAW